MIIFLVQKIGPYHDARLKAWHVMGACITAVEFRADDAVYIWSELTGSSEYGRCRTSSSNELRALLSTLKPVVVVCTGYADVEIQVAMAWALENGVPLVTCSDSTWADEPRQWVKEASKRVLLRAFDTGLAAGARSRDYLVRLGFSLERLFRPWDTVDNVYFASGSRRAGVPPYFLCVARFVPKKNLGRLIKAYGHYIKETDKPWRLVISGSGPLDAQLRELVKATGLEPLVEFPGFLQYPDLPGYYASAGAMVLPSVSEQWGLVVNEAMAAGLPVLVSDRCGCAPDLVREGENGFTFDPLNVDQLAGLMIRISALSDEQRMALGRRSQEIIAEYSPEAFAAGVQDAVECAQTLKGRRVSLLTKGLVRLLAMRRK